jgi:hypothetical protein
MTLRHFDSFRHFYHKSKPNSFTRGEYGKTIASVTSVEAPKVGKGKEEGAVPPLLRYRATCGSAIYNMPLPRKGYREMNWQGASLVRGHPTLEKASVDL